MGTRYKDGVVGKHIGKAMENAVAEPTLYLYVIHTQQLTQRALRLHATIQQLRTLAMGSGYRVKPYLILKPDVSHVNTNIQQTQAKVTYDPVGDSVFDNMRQIMSVEMISNIERHLDAWKRIYECDSTHPQDVFMVIEDDMYLLNDAVTTFPQVIRALSAKSAAWDIVFTGISRMEENASVPIQFIPIKDTLKTPIIPAKDSYFIKQQTAKRLLDMMDKYRFPMRVQMSYLLHKAPEIRAMHPNKRIALDGSKIGIFPSSVHPTNVLVFNKEYMDMFAYLAHDKERVTNDFEKIRGMYKAVEHMNNPDIKHLYGVLLFKAGHTNAAKDMLVDAVESMHHQHGVINSRSDLMSNLINIYQHMQSDLAELLQSTSTYDDPMLAEPDAVPA
jgi:hypothetical protein